MSSMNKEAIVLKSDGAGRVQTPVARQMELVREFERSGLSGPRFAALAGVRYQTFCHLAAQARGSEAGQEAVPFMPGIFFFGTPLFFFLVHLLGTTEHFRENSANAVLP